MKRFTIVLLTVICASSTAFPEVIFSNFPANTTSSWAPNRSLIHFGPCCSVIQNNQFAMGFAVPVGSTFQFTGFSVPLAFPDGLTDVDFTIASDSNGKPGAALETFTVAGATMDSAVYTENSLLNPILAGGNYWLEAAISPSGFGDVSWNMTATGVSGPVAAMSSPFAPPGWSTFIDTQAAFEIDGIAVPEPAYVAIPLFGLLVFMYRIRRGKLIDQRPLD